MDFLYYFLFAVINILFLVNKSEEAPAVACRSCGGHCKGNEILPVNVTDTELLDAIVDNETVRILNISTIDENASGENGNSTTTETKEKRLKRESYIEKRTCSSRFQLELFMIPVSIAMIPFALVSLLLCVCFCGPKETRGRAPEKILGLRLSQRKKMASESFDTVSMKSVDRSSQKKLSAASAAATEKEEEELEYKDGYVQRRDSKKTRFSTNVLFIDPPMRRASSVSCLEGLQSRSGSFAVPVPQTTATEISEEMESRKLSRHISFNDSVSILGEEAETIAPLPESVKRKSIFKRSVSVN